MLDPEGPEEWAALRAHAHALVDASLDRLQSAREGRVWTPPPAELKASLQAPLPRDGTPIAQVATDLAGLLPYGVGNTHPRFFGWVHGAGCPSGVLPELVGAALNANCGGREHAAIYVEKQVLRWARENGCVWGTFTCLMAARGGHLEVLRWARENGCPWDARTCEALAEGGHLEMLRWARENGCPEA